MIGVKTNRIVVMGKLKRLASNKSIKNKTAEALLSC